MRIVFLGRSGAGKTTMIASGLAELTTSLGLRVAVRDRQRLARARRAVARGRRAPRTRGVPTSRAVTRSGARLDCTDHDGRLLDRPVPDDRMAAALAVCEALVLVVDATTLTEHVAPARVARLAVEVRRRVHALERDPRPVRLPVVLALTHTDRLPAADVRSATALFDPIRAAAGGRIAGITLPVSAAEPERCALPLLWCMRHERADPLVEAALIDVWPSGVAHPWTGAAQARFGVAS
ncbi:hypothetical protein [Pseudonocardia sp.]|uniref:hypothetical protein n=1 Tax=Pseudonocardia sp. TaxID=60912 RepID=UPI003D0AC7AF